MRPCLLGELKGEMPSLFCAIIVLLMVLIVQSSKILQITDVHLDIHYNTKGDRKQMCHLNPSVVDKLGQFGDYMCDAPKSLVKHMMKEVAKILPQPDLVLLTGDYVPHIADYNFTYVYKSVQIVTGLIRTYYPDAVVLPIFGNHDSVPPNYFPDHNCTICGKIHGLWKHWIGNGSKETFVKGGYYKYQLNAKTIIVALNTNLYYRFNGAINDFLNKDDPAGQFTFLIDVLEDAVRTKKTVNVIAHIAPGVFERTPHFTWMEERYNQRLIDITVQYASVIGWMIFGHHHTDTFHIVKNAKGEPVQVYLMAPAVTPWFSSLPGAGSVNPSFRIYDMDDNTQQLTDATTYWIDLSEMNHNESTPWTAEYSMRTAYGIESLNATSMNFILEMLKKNDEKTWWKYIEYNSVKWNVTMPVGAFRAAQLCSIEYADFAAYNACMPANSWPKTTTTISTSSSRRSPLKSTAQKPSSADHVVAPLLAVLGLQCLVH